MNLSGDSESDRILRTYVAELYKPTAGVTQHPEISDYEAYLTHASEAELKQEAEEMGKKMRAHGLVSSFHASLLLHLIAKEKGDLVHVALRLSDTRQAEWYKH